jgi:hypothetical protein
MPSFWCSGTSPPPSTTTRRYRRVPSLSSAITRCDPGSDRATRSSAAGSSSGKSAGRPAGPATVTVPSSAGSQSQRVRVAAACPRPSAVTSAQQARSRPCPSPSPVHRRVPTQRTHLGSRPVPGHEQDAPATPQRRLEALPYLGCGRRGWANQNDLTAVQQRHHHLRPGGPGSGTSRVRLGSRPRPTAASTPASGSPAIAHQAPTADALAASARHSRPNSATATTDPRVSLPAVPPAPAIARAANGSWPNRQPRYTTTRPARWSAS